MKRPFIAGALFALIIPFAASAVTVDELKAQIQSLLQQVQQLQQQLVVETQGNSNAAAGNASTTPLICRALPFARSLFLGMRGDDVATLQKQLIEEGLLTADSATGFFGPLTQAAVQRWQAANNIVSSGDQNTTGWGVVGKKTLEALRRRCKDYRTGDGNGAGCVSGGSTYPEGYATTSIMNADGTTDVIADARFMCRNGQWKVEGGLPGDNALTITSISGPTALAVGATGTWTVQVGTTSTSTLTYYVTWGDEDAFSQILAFGQVNETATSSPVFTHTYTRAGKFTARFGVRDANGRSARKSLAITIGQTDNGTGGDAEVSTQCKRWVHGTNMYTRDYVGGPPYIIGTVEVYGPVSQSVCREYFTTSGGGVSCTNTSDTGYCNAQSTDTQTTNTGARCTFNGTSYADGSRILTCTMVDNGKTCIGPISGGTNVNTVAMLCTNGQWVQQ